MVFRYLKQFYFSVSFLVFSVSLLRILCERSKFKAFDKKKLSVIIKNVLTNVSSSGRFDAFWIHLSTWKLKFQKNFFDQISIFYLPSEGGQSSYFKDRLYGYFKFNLSLSKRYQRDSNLNCQSKRRGCWLLDRPQRKSCICILKFRFQSSSIFTKCV